MSEWDYKAVNDWFLNEALEAEGYLNDLTKKRKENISYEMLYDEHLARYYVFNSLHGKVFLKSKKSLLNQLESMLNNPNIPQEIIIKNREESYLMHFKYYVNNIIEYLNN